MQPPFTHQALLSVTLHQGEFLQLRWTTVSEKAFLLSELLDELCSSVGVFLVESSEHNPEGALWNVESLFSASLLVEVEHLGRQLDQVCHQLAIAPPAVEVVPEKNWLAENHKTLTPLRVGCFYIHQSFHTPPQEKGLYPLHIDAATAFGSGYHETTRGCLMVLEQLWLQDPWITALDLGCGSGILTLAMNMLAPASALGADCEEEAVRVSQENARLNNLPGHFYLSEGFSHPHIQKEFCLVVANILAPPLRDLAPCITRFCQKYALLSGLLTTQVPSVQEAYTPHGWFIKHHLPLGQWSTLLLGRRP